MNGSDPIRDAHEEIARLKVAHRIACSNVVDMNDHNVDLTKALEKALLVMDALLTELVTQQAMTGKAMPIQLGIAKNNFDLAMQKLLRRRAVPPELSMMKLPQLPPSDPEPPATSPET